MSDSYRDIFQRAYAVYENIGSICVPVLNNEEVLFTHAGFIHLLRKRRRSRPIGDRIRRLRLVEYIVQVLLNPEAKVSHRSVPVSSGKLLEYWELSAQVEGKKIAVIVSQIKPASKTFLSVMD